MCPAWLDLQHSTFNFTLTLYLPSISLFLWHQLQSAESSSVCCASCAGHGGRWGTPGETAGCAPHALRVAAHLHRDGGRLASTHCRGIPACSGECCFAICMLFVVSFCFFKCNVFWEEEPVWRETLMRVGKLYMTLVCFYKLQCSPLLTSTSCIHLRINCDIVSVLFQVYFRLML